MQQQQYKVTTSVIVITTTALTAIPAIAPTDSNVSSSLVVMESNESKKPCKISSERLTGWSGYVTKVKLHSYI